METTANVSAKIKKEKWENAAAIINLRLSGRLRGRSLDCDWSLLPPPSLLHLLRLLLMPLPPLRLSARRHKHTALSGHFLASRQSVWRTKVRTAPSTHPTQLLALSTLDAASSHLRRAAAATTIGGRLRVGWAGWVGRLVELKLQCCRSQPAGCNSLCVVESPVMKWLCFILNNGGCCSRHMRRTDAAFILRPLHRETALHFRDERSTCAVA